MIACERVLGNAADALWAGRLAGAHVSVLALDGWEVQKRRLRRDTEDGVEVAVSLDRGAALQDGDVLAWEPDARRAVVVRVAPREVLHIRLEPAPPAALAERALKLGHVLGNQHWPALAVGLDVYVPLAVDRRVMAAVMETHALQGVSFAFEPGDGPGIPYVAPAEHDHVHGR